MRLQITAVLSRPQSSRLYYSCIIPSPVVSVLLQLYYPVPSRLGSITVVLSRPQSSRFYPANLEVIDWLGSYFIEHQVSEKAILYFERATLIQPAEVKWHLIIASCYRRAGNYQRALAKYKEIHVKFPDNIECEYW